VVTGGVGVPCGEDRDAGLEVTTRFDNAGRLIMERRHGNADGSSRHSSNAKRLGHPIIPEQQMRPLGLVRRLASFSQVTPATPAQLRPLPLQSTVLFGVLLAIEVLSLPPPPGGPASSGIGAVPAEIGAIVWSIRDERVRELLACNDGASKYSDMDGFICVGPAPAGLGESVSVQEVGSEVELFDALVALFRAADPAVVLGYDLFHGSLGLLLERAQALGLRSLKRRIARAASGDADDGPHATEQDEDAIASQVPGEAGQRAPQRRLFPPELLGGGIELPGRLVLNVSRILRSDAKLTSSSVQTAAKELLGETVPLHPPEVLAQWWRGGGVRGRFEALRSVLRHVSRSFRFLDELNVLPRAAETARMLGLDVLSVLSRGSQYRVEGLLTRAAHRDRLLLMSPSKTQVASQRGAECIPLVMEPRSGFYFDPVLVLDFQSLYPSIVIAYNICFSTCVGRLGDAHDCVKLGVLEDYRRPQALHPESLSVLPSEAVFVKRRKKCGVLTRMLHEILQTRIMVKRALKQVQGDCEGGGDIEARARLLDARQFGLKMIANVTYGYTSASFSGRMPCVEVADAIVQTARRTLERAVRWVEREVPGAEVVYGDTDSLFVHLPGRSKAEAFAEGSRIAREVTKQNPRPVELKFDKVYLPSCLVSKKRYVGRAWQSPTDTSPLFDAKGIETVRRDQCAATQRIMRGALEAFFDSGGDLSCVKRYLQEHAARMRSGRFALQDFIFYSELRPQEDYRGAGPLAAQAVRRSGKPWPSPGERVAFVVAEGPPGSRLRDHAVPPGDVTGGRPITGEVDAGAASLYLDVEYYLKKQIAPTLHRLFALVRGPDGEPGYADVRQWLSEGPRLRRRDVAAGPHAAMMRSFARSCGTCVACGGPASAAVAGTRPVLGNARRSPPLCMECSSGQAVPRLTETTWRRQLWEARLQRCMELCLHCSGSAEASSGCRSIHCDVFFRKVNAQVQLSTLGGLPEWPATLNDW